MDVHGGHGAVIAQNLDQQVGADTGFLGAGFQQVVELLLFPQQLLERNHAPERIPEGNPEARRILQKRGLSGEKFRPWRATIRVTPSRRRRSKEGFDRSGVLMDFLGPLRRS